MILRKPIVCAFGIAACGAWVAGCSTTPEVQPSQPKIVAGAPVQLVSQTMDGGTVTYTKSGDSLSGIAITVPHGSYSSAHTYTISEAPVVSSHLSAGAHLLTPMITISNGGGVSDSVFTVRVPIHLASTDFALAFSANDDGLLEALPLLGEDSASITFATTHFEHSNIADLNVPRTPGGKAQVQSVFGSSNVIVLAANAASLMGTSQHTGFRPGTDDWEFPNIGSTLTPDGECMGQTLGMIWYYYNNPKNGVGKPSLWNLLDNDQIFPTPNIWEDDVAAYRYCSVLQTEGYKPFLTQLAALDAILQIQSKVQPSDLFTLLAFKLAIQETGMPQYVSVRRDGGGHALAVYGVTGTTINVCDPNFPGRNDRTITFNGGGFDPYNSADKIGGPGHLYPRIYFIGKTSIMDWLGAANHWAEVENRTIGSGDFPEFIVQVQDRPTDNFITLTDGWHSQTGTPAFQLSYGSAAGPLVIDSIFTSDGTRVPRNFGRWNIPAGATKLGFYVTDTAEDWAGFKWFDLETAPPPTSGSSIFPLADENTWVFQYSSFDTTGTVTENGLDSIHVYGPNSIQFDANTRAYYTDQVLTGYLIDEPNGVAEWDGIHGDGTRPYLIYPASPGDTCYLVKELLGNTELLSEDYVVTAANISLTTPAGTFNSTQYSTEFRDTSGTVISLVQAHAIEDQYFGTPSFNYKVVRSFSPGVGPVETDEYAAKPDGTLYLARRELLLRYTLH